MPGSTAWIMRRTPMTLVSNSACAWLMLVFLDGTDQIDPGIIDQYFDPASAPSTFSTQALTEASSRTSSGTSSTPASGRVVARGAVAAFHAAPRVPGEVVDPLLAQLPACITSAHEEKSSRSVTRPATGNLARIS